MECGRFQVNDINFEIGTGGSHLEIKANSVPVKGTCKGSKKYRAWEGADLKTITEQVAKDSDLEVEWEVESDAKLSRTDQDGESDLELLDRLCDENGHCLKITDGKVVVFDEEDYEKREPVFDLKPGVGLYDSMKLHTSATGTAKSATVSWTSPRTGKTVTETFTPEEPPEGTGTELFEYRRYNRDGDNDEDEADESAAVLSEHEWEVASGNVAEQKGGRKAKAKKRAAKELRGGKAGKEGKEAGGNKKEWECSFKAPGDVKWNAGQTFTLSQDFGKFARKYIVQDVTHHVSRSDGYTCDVKGHGVLKGY